MFTPSEREDFDEVMAMSVEDVEEELARLELESPTVTIIMSCSEWDWIMGVLETMAREPDALDRVQASEALDYIEALLKEGKV
tara:strand:- start:124 stop:372 length:249 start_codon:yes stop_codon:yes gene_type:complete